MGVSRFDRLGKSCRHHDPLAGIQKGEDCKLGHNIRKIVTTKNGGPEGLAFKMPCRPGPECLADCPSYDPRTDKEIAERKKAISLEMDLFVERLPKIAAMKRKMIANNLSSAKATCPWCDKVDAFKLSCAVGYNNHVHGKCASCGKGFME